MKQQYFEFIEEKIVFDNEKLKKEILYQLARGILEVFLKEKVTHDNTIE